MKRSRRMHEFFKMALSPIMVPIKDGPLKGKRWILTSGSNFLAGRYEPEKTRAIADVVQPGDVVFDIGAHVGYFTVLMSGIVGSEGRIFAFEPRGINKHFLKRHLKANRCENVEIIEACVGNRTGTARLETRVGTGTGYVSDSGNVEVEMVTIDGLVESGRLPRPDFIKMDVEGGEMMVLEGAAKTIEAHHPRMVLATHGDEIDARCQDFLKARGYALEDIHQPKGDKEMIARYTGAIVNN